MSATVGRFGNRYTERDGYRFDSRAEADDWTMLCLYQTAGQITELKRQVRFVLQPAFTDSDGERQRAITWTADFAYVKDGMPTIWETKGFATQVYLMKLRLFKFCYPEYKVWIHNVESKRRTR